MKLNKKAFIILAVLILILGAAIVWYQTSHVFVKGDPYPKNSETLDLRGSGISAEYFESLSYALPDCKILWDIPFQGNY